MVPEAAASCSLQTQLCPLIMFSLLLPPCSRMLATGIPRAFHLQLRTSGRKAAGTKPVQLLLAAGHLATPLLRAMGLCFATKLHNWKWSARKPRKCSWWDAHVPGFVPHSPSAAGTFVFLIINYIAVGWHVNYFKMGQCSIIIFITVYENHTFVET